MFKTGVSIKGENITSVVTTEERSYYITFSIVFYLFNVLE